MFDSLHYDQVGKTDQIASHLIRAKADLSSPTTDRNIAQWQSRRLISVRFKVQVLVFRPHGFVAGRHVNISFPPKWSLRLTDRPFGYEPNNVSSILAAITSSVLWCKGSTEVFDTFSVRSNRTGTATHTRRVTLAGRRVGPENRCVQKALGVQISHTAPHRDLVQGQHK